MDKLFNLEREERYWLTPPEIYNQLDNEFHFNFDPCPFPKAEGHFLDGKQDCEVRAGNGRNQGGGGTTARPNEPFKRAPVCSREVAGNTRGQVLVSALPERTGCTWGYAHDASDDARNGWPSGRSATSRHAARSTTAYASRNAAKPRSHGEHEGRARIARRPAWQPASVFAKESAA